FPFYLLTGLLVRRLPLELHPLFLLLQPFIHTLNDRVVDQHATEARASGDRQRECIDLLAEQVAGEGCAEPEPTDPRFLFELYLTNGEVRDMVVLKCLAALAVLLPCYEVIEEPIYVDVLLQEVDILEVHEAIDRALIGTTAEGCNSASNLL